MMLHITYENANGQLRFSGGKGAYPWRVLQIDGLALAEKSLSTAVYPSQAGQTTLSETVGARYITMQCDIRSSGSRQEIAKALKILNEPGTLTVATGGCTRKIEARCVETAPGERYGGYQIFALQFVCDYPYFEDPENTAVPIYQCEKLIGSGTRWYLDDNGELKSESITPGGFQLPGLLSKRISETNVLNMGDVDTEPTILITMLGEAGSGSLLIYRDKGEQNEQKLELDFPAMVKRKTEEGTLEETEYIPENGDVITIDIPNRQIYNQKGDNLLSGLSLDSFLSDFWLQRGNNLIQVENSVSNSCTVVCRYSNKYVEAVIA